MASKKQMFQANPTYVPTPTPEVAKAGKKPNPFASTDEGVAEYEAWRKQVWEKSLAEALGVSGVSLTKSKNGYDQFVMAPWAYDEQEQVARAPKNGEVVKAGDQVERIELQLTQAAINAVRDLPVYKTLEWHDHIAWYDPSVDSTNPVRWVYMENEKNWVGWDWKNGGFKLNWILSHTPEEMRVYVNECQWEYNRNPNTRTEQRLKAAQDNLSHKLAVIRKHEVLDRFVRACYYKRSLEVLLYSEADVAEFNRKVYTKLEGKYSEVYDEKVADWNEAATNRKTGAERPEGRPSYSKRAIETDVAIKDAVEKMVGDPEHVYEVVAELPARPNDPVTIIVPVGRFRAEKVSCVQTLPPKAKLLSVTVK